MCLAWVPLMYLHQQKKSVWWVILAFLGWNLGSIGWLGAVAVNQAMALIPALMVNTSLFSLAWWLFRKKKQILSPRFRWLSLPLAWVPIEWIHFYWDLDFPWLTVGNALADWPSIIQWYSITGVAGGSFWILAINGILFEIWLQKKWKNKFYIALLSTVIIAPILVSVSLNVIRHKANSTNEKNTAIPVVVVQPNIDSYTDKYDWGKFADQFHWLAKESQQYTKPNTWIVWPETAVPGNFLVRFPADVEPQTLHIWQLDSLSNLSKRMPETNFLVGASCAGIFRDEKAENGQRIETYNAFLWYRNGILRDVYQKSKMVAGVEKLPFENIIPGIKSLALDFGGTTESLYGQDHLASFDDGHATVCPLICFEQDFGKHAASGNHANFIAVGTNDGWWNNTNGHIQHFSIAKVRAIENGKWVARAANTGISGFINPEGAVVGKTLTWNQQGSIFMNISSTTSQTIYAQWGDWFVVLLSIILGSLQIYGMASRKN